MFGRPLHELEQTLPEWELVAWATYRAQKGGLPFRRLELMLAQIAVTQARTAGNKDLKLSDFLLRDADLSVSSTAPPPPATRKAALRKLLGFNPRKKARHGSG